MSFKKYIFTSLVAILLLPACQDYLRGRKKDPVVEVNGSVECIKETPKKFSAFFEDQSKEKEISQVFSCLNQALVKFASNTRGESREHYKGEELQHFFNRYLLEENKISDAFMKQMMRLKVLVVGGKVEVLTRSELEELIKFNDFFASELEKINGHIKMLSFQNESDFSRKKKNLSMQLKLSLQNILGRSKAQENKIKFSDFKDFILEFSLFLNRNEALKKLVLWLPLIESAKDFFIGESASLNSKQDWVNNINWAVDAYFKALEAKYEFSKLQLSHIQDFKQFIQTVDESIALLESSHQFNVHRHFKFSAMDNLLAQIWKLGLVESKISLDVVQKTLHKAIHRFLSPADAVEIPQITQSNLNLLKSDWNEFKVIQLDLIQYLEKNLNSTLGMYADHLKELNLDRPETHNQTLRLWREMFLKYPLLIGENNKIIIHQKVDNERILFKGVTQSNMIRLWIHLALRGYGDQSDRQPLKQNFTIEALKNIEKDFRPIGQALQILDPRQTENAPKRTHLEGNFFTFSGNGDHLLSGQESFELLHLMISASLSIAEKIRTSLETNPQCHAGRTDEQGFVVFIDSCFKSELRSKFLNYFSGLPQMTESVLSMSDQKWDLLYKKLQMAAKDAGVSPVEIEQGGIRTMITVIQYVEVLVNVYDKNHDHMLSTDELLKASERFRGFIRNIVKDEFKKMCMDSKIYEKDWFIDNVFLYLIHKGTKPKKEDWKLIAGHIWDKLWDKLPNVGRDKIVEVLGVLKSDMSSSKSNVTAAKCDEAK